MPLKHIWGLIVQNIPKLTHVEFHWFSNVLLMTSTANLRFRKPQTVYYLLLLFK